MTNTGQAGNNKPLLGALSLGYSLTALIFAYFYFFPTLITPLFSDALIVLSVLLLLSCLIFAALKAKSSRGVILVLLGIMLASILARAIPHLRLSYPPLGDPYYYAISTLNIIDYGTLQPILADWYSGVYAHLHWPIMHLLTAIAVQISGIDSMWFFRFQEPLLGGLFVLAVFALAKEATKNNTVALLSALIASLSDVVIFYQSEYHPQGLALILFVLLLYIYLKSRTTGKLRYQILALVFLVVFLSSHHFSSLFVALLAVSFVGMNHLISILPQRLGQITQATRDNRADYNLWLIVVVAGLAYHFWIYEGVVRSFLRTYGFINVTGTGTAAILEPGNVLLDIVVSTPMYIKLLNATKWGILLLAAPSIIRVIRTPRLNEARLLVLLACVLFAGFAGTYIVWGPVDRIIVFYAPLVSVFAALTVHKLLTLDQVSLWRSQAIKITTVIIVGLLLAAGFFRGINTPVFYLQSSQMNSYYWYSNQLPNVEEYKVAGEWTGMHIPQKSKIGTGWYIRTSPFFFGKRNLNNVGYATENPTMGVDYIMFDPEFPRSNEEAKMYEPVFDRDLSVIYDNGEVKMYKVPR